MWRKLRGESEVGPDDGERALAMVGATLNRWRTWRRKPGRDEDLDDLWDEGWTSEDVV